MDDTEEIRRGIMNTMVIEPDRESLEAVYGIVWNTEELGRDFEVMGFMAPFVVVKRKSDGVKGSLQFQPNPRFYYSFSPD